MKKISDFIVEKRYFVLVIMLILMVISLFMSSKVKINYDMTNYLPSDSETRIGLDIMDKEFDDANSSTLNIKVIDINEDEALDSYNYLKDIDNVSVTYDAHDNEALYYITLDNKAESKEAAKLYDLVKDHFKNKIEITAGTISDHNSSVLPFYVIVIAVVSALIILIIMCESYIEPFLFLISILIAVALNAGTNIIFDSVSNITNSISAILQMALSMDYSIMLMNRYRQERSKEKDKVKAMKEALFNAFKAISSSSITTIVGLIALVFMTFTIGRDLGFVLAKGVLFSLISIFTCLPCLILMCDKLIFKTKKKSLNIKMKYVSKFAYAFRHASIITFVIVLVGSFLLKGNLGILFTSTGSKEDDEIFASNNQIAIVYPNSMEEKIHDYCKKLEDNNHIDEVLCYGNTINEDLTYSELKTRLEDYDVKTDVSDSVYPLLYYYYYKPNDNSKIELNTLLSFIINSDDELVEPDIKDKLKDLTSFTNHNEIKKIRTSKELATKLGVNETTINNLFTYYNSKHLSTKLTLSEFISYMNNDILTNKEYSKMIDESTKDNLKLINNYLDKKMLTKKISSTEMAKIFNLDPNIVNSLYTYYQATQEVNNKVSINSFVNFINTKLLNNPNYASYFDKDTKDNLILLTTFINKDLINKQMTSKELSSLYDIPEANVSLLLMMKSKETMSLYEFNNYLISLYENSDVDKSNLTKLYLLKNVMDSTIEDKTYTYEEMSNILPIDITLVRNIYSMMEEVTLTPYEFVNFILNHQNDELLKGNINSETISKLTLLKSIMDSVINNTKYSSKELSNYLGTDNLDLIYSMYEINKQHKKINLSYETFISFLVNDVMNNKEYSKLIDNNTKDKLININNIMKDSLNNKKYSSSTTYNKLKGLTSEISSEDVDLLYLYYNGLNNYNDDWTLTIEEFVDLLNNKVLHNKMFTRFIDEDMEKTILDSKKTVKEAKDMLIGDKYSRVVLNTNYEPEAKETFEFIENLRNDLKGAYVAGDSPMAYEMSKSFGNELNLITVLTMIFIFIVVVITFKSIIVPIALVLLIQCAVFVTMGILSFGGDVYFMSILIVQSILMGATIDYAILYTSYYQEARQTLDIKESILKAYQNSIHTILNSSLILMIVTLIVGVFSSSVASKICTTISEGALCSVILIIFLLPSILVALDKYTVKIKK